jgi:hypothetical protein
VGGVGILPVGLSRNDDADRRLLRLHGADLHRRGMGAQNLALATVVGLEKESVVHLAGRMAVGKVQRGEIVVVGLDIRTFGDGEAHVGEDGGDLVDDLADGVDAAALGRRRPHGRLTSTVSRASRSVMAASLSSVLRAAMASATRALRPLIAGPASWRSSGVILPRPLSSSDTEPFLPSAATRTLALRRGHIASLGTAD